MVRLPRRVGSDVKLCIAHGGDMGEPSGGTDRVSTLAAGLADRGFDVTLVVPEPSGPIATRLGSVTVEFVKPQLSSALARASAVVRTAARIADREDAHLQLEHSSLAGVGTLHGIDGFVLDMHDLAYSRFDHVGGVAAPVLKRGVKWLETRAVARASHVIAVSESMVDVLQETWNVPSDRVSVVPNGYHPETVEPAADVPVEPGRVAFLGTLHPKVDVGLLEAITNLDRVTELVVVGDGAQREAIDRLAASSEKVLTTGRLPDGEAFELLGGAEVLVNPQTVSAIQRASAPVKLYYYAALGKPMVVTAGPSLVDTLVRHDAAATAYAAGGFLSGVQRFLSDDDFAKRVGSNAAALAEAFEWSNRVAAVAELYEGEI